MITDENLPDGWTAAAERTEYDELIDREYDSRRYEREDGGATVFVNEVQRPKDLDGWGYQVAVEHDTGEAGEEKLGLFEDLEGAREAALDYMADS